MSTKEQSCHHKQTNQKTQGQAYTIKDTVINSLDHHQSIISTKEENWHRQESFEYLETQAQADAIKDEVMKSAVFQEIKFTLVLAKHVEEVVMNI